MRYVVACITLLMGLPCLGEDIAPGAILEKAAAAYKAMQTYKAEGNIVSNLDTGAVKGTAATSFTILLKKPNLYLVTWSQKNSGTPEIQSGAVWSTGTQPYLYMSSCNAYSPMTDDSVALGAATGISGGAAATIPFVFLAAFPQDAKSLFSRLTNPMLKGSERIGEEDCYVIGGPSLISKEETFWISKTSHLLQKYSRSLEAPAAGRTMPELTDEQIEENIKAMGLGVTEQRKKDTREMMENMAKASSMKGTITESHVNISSPKLNAEDFNYTPPEGATLKKSLFGDMLSSRGKASCPVTALPKRPEAQLNACVNNLKQCGLVFKMFANETPKEMAPPLSPMYGCLMWDKGPLYPEYITDPTVLLCPCEENKQRQASDLKGDGCAAFCFDNASYWYLGYALPEEKTGLAFVEAYRKQGQTGQGFETDLKDAAGKPIRRLQMGIERFFLTDIGAPNAALKMQAKVPIFIERPSLHDQKVNVLFLDGHVETLAYPGEYPVSQHFIDALESLDALRKR